MRQANGGEIPDNPMADRSIVVVETEDLYLKQDWQFLPEVTTTDGSTPTGTGLMKYTGQSWIGASNLSDPDQSRQGKKESWLVVKFWVDVPGRFDIDVRGYHEREDGDNDFWMGHFPFEGTIERHFARDPLTIDWIRGRRWEFDCSYGLNAIFVNGRSTGYAIDRIIVFKSFPFNSIELARDLEQVAANPYPSRSGTTIFDLDRRIPPDQNSGNFDSWLGNVFYEASLYPWFYHSEHGWIHASSGDTKGAWLYDFQLGFNYVDPELSNWLYNLERASWIYHLPGTTSPRWFYNDELNEYFSINPSGSQ